MKRSELAASIYRCAHLEGEFELRSGQVATEYFDKYRFESEPALLRAIAESMLPILPPGPTMLAGLELGGVPLVTVLSQLTGLPALFVRKSPKGYGTRKLAEGPDIEDQELLIVEDVVTTGGQVIQSANHLRALGSRVAHALIVIDREQGGRGHLSRAGIEMHALFTMSELQRGAR
jgi:orotate phosphoribosyltransferase